ncbi:MAG: nuclear transport factor 2 family protein [Nitrososphaera sp.]|jgi:ketosteroid isomerase-like protein
MPLTGEEMVYRYFKCIDTKDLDGILDLFDHDATIHEPFSNISGGLRGRSSIQPFLKVAMMASTSLQRTISLEKPTRPGANKITALVTFEKGDRVKGRFTFEFTNGEAGSKKIRSLNIEFFV